MMQIVGVLNRTTEIDDLTRSGGNSKFISMSFRWILFEAIFYVEVYLIITYLLKGRPGHEKLSFINMVLYSESYGTM